MNDHEQLVQQIRFALETLGELNAHHDFERLCIGLARRRVTSNILPATGPVSAGGDQGRDGESHWTNLAIELPGTSAFVALASTEPVVLACTIQKKSVPGKIEKDVRKICKEGTPVRRIVYFTATPIPVARRHQLQAKAKKDHKVALDIWDAPAIAEHLADEDLFYLAVSHLKVPSSLAPQPRTTDGNLPSWYLEARTRWREERPLRATLGALMDLREPLRYATFNSEARSDLPDWIAETRHLLGATDEPGIATRCRYEAVVATYRGLGDMSSVEDLARQFLDEVVETSDDPGLLEDSFVMIQYMYGHWVRKGQCFSRQEIDSYTDRLAERVDENLLATGSRRLRLTLLSLSARIALNPRYPDDIHSENYEVLTLDWDGHLERTDPDMVPDAKAVLLRDRDKGMQSLLEVATETSQAPLFPVRPTADIFELMSPFLVDHSMYKTVRDGLDSAVEETEGKSGRGQRAWERANRMLEAGQLLAALSEVHEAKINWWRGDTVGLGIEMAMLASELYSEMGLPLAAKQYALSAATLANADGNIALAKYIPAALMQAAVCDYRSGMWLSATGLAEISLSAHGALNEAPGDADRHPYLERLVGSQAHLFSVAQRSFPECLPIVQPIISGLFGADAKTELERWSEQWAHSEGETQMLFADAGTRREYRWKALGREWEVSCRNERISVLAAERFAAMLQVVLCEMAASDPLFVPGRSTIDVLADVVPGNKAEAAPSAASPDPGGNHTVHLTPLPLLDAETAHVEASASVLSVVFAASLRPEMELKAWLNEAFDQGLWHKLLSARPYDETADLLSDVQYTSMAQVECTFSHPEVFPSSALTEFTGYPTGFNSNRHTEIIQRRYEKLIPATRFTVEKLRQDTDFQAVVSRLEAEGWLDWHLLLAIGNLVGNERVQGQAFVKTGWREGWSQERAVELMTRAEFENERLSTTLFTEEQLRHYLNMSLPATLKNYGLECHTNPPDFASIFKFLGERFGYWKDDVDHEDVFHRARQTASG